MAATQTATAYPTRMAWGTPVSGMFMSWPDHDGCPLESRPKASASAGPHLRKHSEVEASDCDTHSPERLAISQDYAALRG